VNERRKLLMLVLVPLVLAPIAVGVLGLMGSPELYLWLFLLVAWLIAFIGWGRTGREQA
jgi:hypothetical protein